MKETVLGVIDILDILKFVFGALVVIITFFSVKLKSIIQKRYLKAILGFNKNACEVMMPIRFGVLEVDEALGAEKYTLEVPMDYTTFEEASSLIAIPQMLHTLNNKSNIFFCDPRKRDRFEELLSPYNNKFCIGSPTANAYVGSLFNGTNDSCILKKAFLLGCKQETYNQEGRANMRTLRIYKEDDSNNKLYLGEMEDIRKENINKTRSVFSFTEDYIVVVKLCPADYNFKEHGSTIIAFGNSATGTKTAVNFFTAYTKAFYQLLKKDNHWDHYFYVFRCSSKGEVDFRGASYVDLTKELLEDSHS